MSSAPPRPEPTTGRIDVDAIPPELRELRQWVTWDYELVEPKNGPPRWTKVPYAACGTRKASTTAPATWATLEDALEAARRQRRDGIGFVFAEDDPYVGIDCDGCLDEDGNLLGDARGIVECLASYTEVSPSGTGVHVLARAGFEGGGRKTADVDGFRELELYREKRFFCVTGWHLDGAPTGIRDAQDAVDELYARYFAPKADRDAGTDPRAQPPPRGWGFRGSDDQLADRACAENGKLCAIRFGNYSEWTRADGTPDESRVRMAALSIIAWWTGPDPARVERIFTNHFPLGQSEKWMSRPTLRADEVRKAIELCESNGRFYDPDYARRREGSGGAEPVDAQPVRNVRTHPELPLALGFTDLRRTGTRSSATCTVFWDGEQVLCVPVSRAAGTLKEARRDVYRVAERMLGSAMTRTRRADLELWIADALAPAGARGWDDPKRTPTPEPEPAVKGPKPIDVIRRHVVRAWKPAFRCGDGAVFYEVLGEAVDARRIGNYRTSALLAELAVLPDHDDQKRQSRTARELLPVVAADLHAEMPDEPAADWDALGVDPAESRAAEHFRTRFLELWTVPIGPYTKALPPAAERIRGKDLQVGRWTYMGTGVFALRNGNDNRLRLACNIELNRNRRGNEPALANVRSNADLGVLLSNYGMRAEGCSGQLKVGGRNVRAFRLDREMVALIVPSCGVLPDSGSKDPEK